MRIGASLLLLNGICYQSYSWDILRPLGCLQTALNSLEKYGCDEIAIIRPVRNKDDCLDADLELLGEIQSMTPISFGGGIRTLTQLQSLEHLPLERLILSSAFIRFDKDLVYTSTSRFGRQAIQCFLPFKHTGKEFLIFDSCRSRYVDIREIAFDLIDQYANEVVLHDTSNEGFESKFNFDILNYIPFGPQKVVVSGGIGPASCREAANLGLASALIENRLLHKEYAVDRYRCVG